MAQKIMSPLRDGLCYRKKFSNISESLGQFGLEFLTKIGDRMIILEKNRANPWPRSIGSDLKGNGEVWQGYDKCALKASLRATKEFCAAKDQ